MKFLKHKSLKIIAKPYPKLVNSKRIKKFKQTIHSGHSTNKFKKNNHYLTLLLYFNLYLHIIIISIYNKLYIITLEKWSIKIRIIQDEFIGTVIEIQKKNIYYWMALYNISGLNCSLKLAFLTNRKMILK